MGPWSQHVSPLLCVGLCSLPFSMAEFRPVPRGRETPQGELRAEVVEDESPRSPVAEEPGRGGGSHGSEAKLSPREEEELDPRIQEELEHLNQASEEINQVELQLDEARTTYRRILQESARKLNTQGSHLGSCIEKARPYYEARRLAKEVWPAGVCSRRAMCRAWPWTLLSLCGV